MPIEGEHARGPDATMARELSTADLLRSAARLIERALIGLDVKHDFCETCTAIRYTNVIHKRTYDRFTDTPLKLREAADALDDPDTAQKRRQAAIQAERDLQRKRREENERLKRDAAIKPRRS